MMDEQFAKFYEMLIRIDENTKNHAKELDSHVRDDISQFALANQSVTAVHQRLDRIKSEFEKSVAFQNKLIGGLILISIVAPIIVSVFLSNK